MLFQDSHLVDRPGPDDLGHLSGLDLHEGGLEVLGDDEVGRARRAEDVVERGDLVVVGAGRARHGAEVLLLGSLVLHLGGLIAAVAVVLGQTPPNGGLVPVDGVLDDVGEVQLRGRRVVPLDFHLHGEFVLHFGGCTVGLGGTDIGYDDILGFDRVQGHPVFRQAMVQACGRKNLGRDDADGGLVPLGQEVPRGDANTVVHLVHDGGPA
mmetsp:Transcript_15360/g.33533  ORF Transcript_15360/g.33533 Transcript_15360/m.33533 type:complete len:209 (-) Transcript_15360:590-1216(-)